MEDTSRDREEEDRPPEEERKPERKRKIRYEFLPDMPYEKYEEKTRRDMDIIFNPSFLNNDGIKFNHTKKEVRDIRRYLLDKTLSDGIPAKFNSSTSASYVFKNTTLEKDRRKKDSLIIYVKYEGKTAFSYNTSRNSTDVRIRETDKQVYDKLKSDLEKEIVEFKKDTFAGQVTEEFEQQDINLGFIDKVIEGPELRNYTPQAFQPSYRDVGDTQQEIIGKMRMDFEEKKYDLESQLRDEENRRRKIEDDFERSSRMNREVLKKLDIEIREKNERIQYLEDQLRTKNFSQFGEDTTNREIQELRAEVSRLENEKDELRGKIKYLEKDLDSQLQSTQELEKQVNEKQRRIEELEGKKVSPSSQKEIAQLRKEKSDLEKQLQAQKRRTELIQEERDKWKKYSERNETGLAAKQEEVLFLTRERDDLNKSIEALKKVNSEKVKEYEDYKVETEEELNRARKEYTQERAELENFYKKEKADLESAISILEKNESLSKSEMDSLKSLLEEKDIEIWKKDSLIEDLEKESFRLRDLNLSLKEIQKGDQDEYNRKLEEIKSQKQEVERAKSVLEERIRKKVQKLKEIESENRKQKETIDSYLSQLENLNKKLSTTVDRKLLQANQNEFTRLQKENENLGRDILQLQREKDAAEQREKILEGNIAHQQKRIEEKDRENTEFVEKEKAFIQERKEFNRKEKTFQQNIRDKDEKIRQKNVTLSRQKEELEELREKSEKLVNAIELQKFYNQQYEDL